MADAATPQASALEQPRFWTLDRVSSALEGGPRGPSPLTRIATDTRTVGPGDCFIALAGEKFDAHDFLADAVAKGAAAVVVHDVSRAAGLGVPVFVVDDTTRALGALARYRRRVWGRPVVGVVGTNGKTSTKELLKAALGSMLRVHATTGNYNNLVGVPLTLFALPDEADIAVIEIGTNQPGEVAALRAIVEPDIVVVTSIAEEHLEGLGDLEGVLKEELSACQGTTLSVVPASQNEVVEGSRARARRTVSAGLDEGDLRAHSWGVDPDGRGRITLGDTTVRVPLRGVHNLRNAMLALAVARECGIAPDAAARGIAGMPTPPMRVHFESHGRATVINDAYNSNPGSARAALELLQHAGAGRQRVAVLGTMLELGEETARLHREVARAALAGPFDVVAGVGLFADALRDEAPDDPRVVTAADAEALWPLLEPRLAADAFILLKGSRGMRLERLVPHLTSWAAR